MTCLVLYLRLDVSGPVCAGVNEGRKAVPVSTPKRLHADTPEEGMSAQKRRSIFSVPVLAGRRL